MQVFSEWLRGTWCCAKHRRGRYSRKRAGEDLGRIPALPHTIWVACMWFLVSLPTGGLHSPGWLDSDVITCHTCFDQWYGQMWHTSLPCGSFKASSRSPISLCLPSLVNPKCPRYGPLLPLRSRSERRVEQIGAEQLMARDCARRKHS